MSTATEQTIVLPLIHMNGTSKRELLDQLRDVYHAVQEASQKLREAAPNQRDYYPVIDRWQPALAQYRRRSALLQNLADELCQQADLMQKIG